MFQFFDFLIVRPLINFIFIGFNFIGDFGLTIILLTILINLLTWPLTKKQLRQSQLLQDLQPEFRRLKKACAGNRQLELLQTAALYKKHQIKPLRSVGLLFLQIPIFIGLAFAVQSIATPRLDQNLKTRAYPLVHQLSRVQALSEKQQEYLVDTQHNTYDFHPSLVGLVSFDTTANLNSVSGVLIFFFCLVIVYSQYKIMAPLSRSQGTKRKLKEIFQDASQGKEPDQAEISAIVNSQMSIMMPLLTLFIMLPLPGAIVFYYAINNVLRLLQQNYIRKTYAGLGSTAHDARVEGVKEAVVVDSAIKRSTTKITRISATPNYKGRQRKGKD